ncbi:hypothetical protein GMORB2_2769 [Geosmithia morbida]|uniref:Mmc1 C-terminal domain-containing protein n=1 Tax=Geosmithia morbida TaxID=1094350 RepID=A0A9P4YQ92_9HYPO|nr:uncharacterized protein GMORB2_2769 [Geosmithia morbida]KAF4120765.1 hypothetical protein GMORB2_2769 [Geosmithia morbida]
MLSGRQIWSRSGRAARLLRPSWPAERATCPFCCTTSAASRLRPSSPIFRRYQSTTTTTNNARAELEKALRELQKQYPNFVELSRLQLALQGLRQTAGSEAIRVAILGLGSGGGDNSNNNKAGHHAARRILSTMLADPLVGKQPWEQKLDSYDPARPLVVRVRPSSSEETVLRIERASTAIEQEQISSAALNGLNLELLLMEGNLHAKTLVSSSSSSAQEAVLNPVVEIPSGEDRFTPVANPVHKTIVVGNGIGGAVDIAALPPSLLQNRESILVVANLAGLSQAEVSAAAFKVVDVALAEEAIALFRQGPQHAMEYERLWYDSKVPALIDWLKAGLVADEADATKPAVRQLVSLVLQNTLSSIEDEESRRLTRAVAASSLPEAGELTEALAQWSQHAHAELQGELDLAFTGRRWRQLGWWKLFWRVDDVAMLTHEILSQRFLPTSEQQLIYLTGRIAGVAGEHASYPQPTSKQDVAAATSPQTSSPTSTKLASGEVMSSLPVLPEWPGHIAFTRRYLQNETIPALQALAQRLVAQAVGTSSAATCLAALVYVSQFTSTFYEASTIAAVGIVYSLGRMQKKWERARDFWQGEVREEGRKAVRGVEDSVAKVLEGDVNALTQDADLPTPEELQKARDLVAQAKEALSRMK